jgi:hypothetical protein
LGVNIGSAGAVVLFNGAGGTPSSMVGTNITGTAAGLTAGSASAVAVGGITGLGTGVATALAINVGSAGALVTFNGAGGTPSSMVGTNITGTASGLTAGVASAVAVGGITGLGTGVATALAINVGSAGAFITFNGNAGTPSALVGTNISGTAASLTAGATTNVTSGTYTPTIANTTNVSASTPAQCQYMRVGSVVTVSGTFQLDPTTAVTDTLFTMTLPIASDFSINSNLGGLACCNQVGNTMGIYAEPTANLAQFEGVLTDVLNRLYSFTFTYLII